MANKILHKRSSVANRVPGTSDLELGEIGINTHDGKVYIHRNNGTPQIVDIAYSDSRARAALSAGTGVSYNASTGQISIGQDVSPSANVTFNNLVVDGDLTINGTTTTINSTTISVDDKTLELGSVTTPTDTTADLGGLILRGATDKTILWQNATGAWSSSENFNIASGRQYLIAGASVLNATTLGSSVVNSSLTTLGEVTSGTWSATPIAVTRGGTGGTSAADARTNLGLGTISTQNANSVAITGGSVNGTPIGNVTVSTGAFSSLTASGAVTFTATTAATSTSSGAVVVSGGVGVAGNLHVGGTMVGVASSARYADLAENYAGDTHIEPGTVVEFGGEKEVTTCVHDHCTRVAGVVSTAPAYLMNNGLVAEHVVAVAFTGRVPCKVQGVIRKGDLLVSAGNGRARAESNPKVGSVIGKALENFDGEAGVIEVVVGRF